jgi:hypothetical protein
MKAIVLCLALSGLGASAQELQFTNIPLRFVNFTNWDASLEKHQWTYYQFTSFVIKDGKVVSYLNGAPLSLTVEDLKKAAESGDAVAQMQFAACLYDGKHGVAANDVEAYKWALVASSNGQPNAKYLVREMELFMAPKEMADGKAAAKSFLK